MIATRWIIAATLLIGTCVIGTSYNYTVSSPYQTLSQTFGGGGGKNTAQVQFTFNTPDKTCRVLMVVQKSSSAPNFTSSLTNASPTQSNACDLQNANIGGTQTVSLTGLNAGDTYYIFIFNPDYLIPKYFFYTISITERLGVGSLCLFPNSNLLNTIYCNNCASSANYGAYCNLYDTILSNGNTENIPMNADSYNHVTIPGSNSQITVTYSTGGDKVQIFVQFQDKSTDIAGYFNYVNPSSGVGRYNVVYANYQFTLQINSGGNSVSIGIKNKDTQSRIFTIGYTTVPSTTNVLAIVLGVLGGLLLIALLVAAYFIIRRVRSSDQQIHPHVSAVIIAQQNALSAQQIETFFPTVLCSTLFSEEQSSINNLSPQQKTTQDRDCVICLCPVGLNDMMKMTYCKHIFHGTCLNEWFKKQRNCPYCRESYNRTQTMDHYQNVLKHSNRNFLAGAQLVQQIFRKKHVNSRIQIEDIKD